MRKSSSQRGLSLITVVVGTLIAGLVLFGAQSALRWGTRVDSQIQLSNELRQLREDATRRLDCNKSLKTPPLCTPKDHRGQPWPNAANQVGKFAISATCSSTGITLLYKTVSPVGEANEDTSLGISTHSSTEWTPVFSDKPVLCEADAITATSPTPTMPYYQLVKAANSLGGGCSYGDDSRSGRIISGAVACPLGYKVVSGGTDCGAFDGDSANVNSGLYLSNSGPYWIMSTSCCSVSNFNPGFTYATCIRE